MTDIKTLSHVEKIHVAAKLPAGNIHFLCRWENRCYIPFYAYSILDNTILESSSNPETVNELWQKYAPMSSRNNLSVVK